MARALSIAEAKATFSERVREVEIGEPILITRHGKAVAALVSADTLADLERLRAAGPQGGLSSLAGGWEGSDELARILDDSSRVERRGHDPLD